MFNFENMKIEETVVFAIYLLFMLSIGVYFFFKNKNKFITDSATDIAETLKKRHAQPTLDLARGYGRGFTSIFGLTPVDILRTSLDKIEKQNPGQAIKSLEKLVGKENAGAYFDKLVKNGQIVDNQKFCENLTEHIAKNFNAVDATGKVDTKKLLNLFKGLEKSGTIILFASTFSPTILSLAAAGKVKTWAKSSVTQVLPL